jgi:hypothetical protein
MMSIVLAPMIGMYLDAERINEWSPEEPPLNLYSGIMTKVSDVRTPDGGEYMQITVLTNEQVEVVFDVLVIDMYYWGFTFTAAEPLE